MPPQTPQAARRTVLIVDDDPEIRTVLRKACAKVGIKCDEAASGSEALQMVRRTVYGAITMDVSMGQLDGIDTVSVLHTESEVPVVAVSAHLTDEIRNELQRRGVSHFVEKPFTLSDVIRQIESAMESVQ